MYPDTLPDEEGPRSFREWTCLRCGGTFYPRGKTGRGG